MSAARSLSVVASGEDVDCLACGARDIDEEIQSAAQMATTRELFRFVRCAHCGLVRLSPRVPADAVGRYYDETYLPHRGASAWGRFANLVEQAQAGTDLARVRRVQASTALSPRSRVLDLGCGRPSFLKRLAAETGAKCVGVDFEGGAWRADPAKWAELELREGTLETSGVRGPFDAITLWHALEHEYDPVATLRRLRTIAAPTAALVVEVPNLDSLTYRLHGEHWAGWHTPRHTAAYTPKTLRIVLERAGWRVEEQLSYGTLDPYVLWWLGRQERLARSVRGPLEGRFAAFVAGKVATWPIAALQRVLSLGVQTAVARPA